MDANPESPQNELSDSPEESIAVRRGPPKATATPPVEGSDERSSPSLDAPSGGDTAPAPPETKPGPVSVPFQIDQGAVLDQGPLDRVDETPVESPKPRFSLQRIVGLSLLAVGILAAIIIGLRIESNKSKTLNAIPVSASQRFKNQTTSLPSLEAQLGGTSTLPATGAVTVNGKLNVSSAIVLQPSAQNGPAVIGQMFFDSVTNSLAYYNGKATVHLQGGGNVTNNTTNVTNNSFNTFITNAAGSGPSINGTPGTLALFATSTTLDDSLLSQSGSTLAIAATTMQGTASSGLGILTANTSGASGDLTIQSGDSSTTSSGTVTIDTGSGVVNGTAIDDFTFETGTDGFDNTPYGGSVAQTTAQAHGGTHSLAVTLQANSWSAASIHSLAVTPGHEYRWSMWMRSSSTPDSGTASVYFRSLNTSSPTVSFTDNTSGWTQVSVNFINPTGNAVVDLGLIYKTTLPSSEVHYLDDVTLTDLNTFTGLAVDVGTTNAQAVNIGNSSQVGDTIITGGTTGVKINDTAGGVYLSGAGGSGDGVIVKPQADSKTAFQVTNTSGSSIFAADTTDSALIIGSGGGTPLLPVIQGAAAVGNNIIGANMIFDAANGTGVGGSGDIVFDTAGGVSDPLVTLDATAGIEQSVSNATMNWTHTTGAESDRVLVVAVDTANTIASSIATGVTYNGVALTEIAGVLGPQQHANGSVWYLVNPPTGAHTVSVSLSGNPSDVGAESTTFYNVDQQNSIAGYATNSVDTTAVSTTLVGTNTGEGVFDAFMARASINNEAPGSGQTQLYGQGFFGDQNFGSFKQGLAGSTTMSWAGGGLGSNIAHVVLALNPEPNVTPDTLTEAVRFTQSGTVGIGLTSGEDAQSSLTFGGTADRSIAVDQNQGTGNGHSLTISAGEGAVGNNNGGDLDLQAGQATGSGITGAVSILTGDAANASGGITLQTGDSSTTSAGNVSLDTGSSTVDGTVIETDGFEDGTDDFGAWTGNNTTAAKDCAEGHSGSCSLAVSSDNGGAALEHSGDFGTSVTPGHHYVFSVYVKADGADNLSDVAGIWGQIIWGNPGGWQYDTSASTQATTTGWTHIQWTGIAPAGAQYIAFVLGGPYNGATVYFDDVSATDLSSSSTTALASLGATNAQAVTLGNMTELGATNIYGSSDINLNSGVSNITLFGGQIIAQAQTNSIGAFQIQDSGGDTLFEADTTDMVININGSLVATGNITVDGHVVTGGNTPGITAGPAACTAPTVSVSGDDTSGTITVTTGTGCASSGDLATLTFNSPFDNTPHVNLTPIGGGSAGLNAFLDGSSLAPTGFSLGTNATPANSTTYKWDYWTAQ